MLVQFWMAAISPADSLLAADHTCKPRREVLEERKRRAKKKTNFFLKKNEKKVKNYRATSGFPSGG